MSIKDAYLEMKDANLAMEMAADGTGEYPEVEQRHADAFAALVRSLAAQGISIDDAQSMAGSV